MFEMFQVVQDDISIKMMESFMGNIFTGGSEMAPWLHASMVFNFIALTIAGFGIGYTVFVGTMNTAHQGEALGKSWNTMWTPVKTLFGVALVVPMIGLGGISAAQMAVFKVATQGVYAADAIYAAGVKRYLTPDIASKSRISYTFTKDIFKSVMCIELAKRGGYLGESSAAYAISSKVSENGTAKYVKFSFGANRECGTLELTVNTKSSPSWFTKIYKSEANASYEVRNAMGAIIQASTVKLIQDLQKPAKKLKAFIFNENNGKAPRLNFDDIDEARRNFDSTINAAASARFGKINNGAAVFKESVSGGWMMAGAMYQKFGRIADEADAIALKPFPRVLRTKRVMYKQNELVWSNRIIESIYAKAINERPEVKADLEIGDGAWMASWIMAAFRNKQDAMLTIRHIGNTASNMAAAVKLGDFTPQGKAFFAATGLEANSIAMLLVTVGFVYSTVLPMLPFLLFLFGSVAWMMLVATAVISIPVWAAWHVLARGDDTAAGGHEKGWFVLFEIFLKPSLMVIGLFMGMELFNVSANFLLDWIFTAAQNNQDGGFNVLSLFFVLMLAGVTMGLLAYMCLSLVAELTGKVLDNLGAQEHSEGGQSRAAQAIAPAAAGAAGALTHGSSVNQDKRKDKGGASGKITESDASEINVNPPKK